MHSGRSLPKACTKVSLPHYLAAGCVDTGTVRTCDGPASFPDVIAQPFGNALGQIRFQSAHLASGSS
eukprot:1160217-Pelagomonas_calceolata.AAC.11